MFDVMGVLHHSMFASAVCHLGGHCSPLACVEAKACGLAKYGVESGRWQCSGQMDISSSKLHALCVKASIFFVSSQQAINILPDA
jgi:hypothetical protein